MLPLLFEEPRNGVWLLSQGNLTSQATFTRASSGTYRDADGVVQTALTNVARKHYLPDGSGNYGLLIEGARTNNVLYSTDASSNWTISNVSRGASASTPINGVTAPLYIPSSASTTHSFNSAGAGSATIDYVSGTTYSFSCFIKDGGLFSTLGQSIFFENPSTSAFSSTNWNGNFSINPSTGAVSGSAASGVTTENYGNGWWRVKIVRTASGTSTQRAFPIVFTGAYGSSTGDNASGVYAVGTQAETGSFASTYIPTSGSAATRAADVCSITLSSVSWFNASEGAFYADYTLQGISGSQRLVTINDGTSANRIVFTGQTGSQAQVGAITSSVSVAAINIGVVAANTRYKAAFAYKTDDYAGSLNGAAVVTDTSGTLPSGLTTFVIGNNGFDTTGGLFGIIRDLRYYPYRLTNTQLQTLTT